MINFKTYLLESKSAPLYHTTQIGSAERILKMNNLYGTEQTEGALKGKRGIFFTRSLHHAKGIYGTTNYVIFVVDQLKLNTRYKIKPVKNWSERRTQDHKPLHMTGFLGGNEFEEFVETKSIKDFDIYVTKIICKNQPDPKKYPLLAEDDRLEVLND